jgi:hypothetical protein
MAKHFERVLRFDSKEKYVSYLCPHKKQTSERMETAETRNATAWIQYLCTKNTHLSHNIDPGDG